MTGMSKLLEKYRQLGEVPTKQQETEYSWYLNEMRKLVKMPYIVMHKRLEKAFDGFTFEFMLSKMKQWFHEAEKHANPGMIINARLKQFNTQVAESRKQKL